ncbi:ComEC/Rec2 family competence protein, partial [Staphylococcus arlettae]|uniref:ComEC/Rec2 family competence protein n=1 Tax=Staphylococcus arlettae TaxID=29378 RepID=UPI003BABC40B
NTDINLDECSIQLLDAAIITSDDKNEHSIITLINYKQYQLLLMADATIRNEQLLLQRYNLKNIDVLKVGHHGSITSSSGEFIASIKPKISVISASKNNRYQFPASQVVSRLAKSSDKIYNTAQHGAITIVFDAQMKTSVEKS